jgi:hypothetical protein
MTVDNKSKVREFYDFHYPKPILEFEESEEYKKLELEFMEGIDLLYKKTENFVKIDKKTLLRITQESSKKEFGKIFLVFRIFTAVSRMSVITYVNSNLISNEIFKPTITTKENGEPKGRRIEFKGEDYPMPNYDKLITMAQDHVEVKSAFLDLFIENDLIQKLEMQKGKAIEEIKKISSIAFKYSQKGSIAAESGKEAEKIVRKKMEGWGMNENRINSVDESLQKILENKLESLRELKKITKEVYKERKKKLDKRKNDKKSARQFDLVFEDPKNNLFFEVPNTDTRKNATVITQIVFFTSNTGSEEKKKRNQNINTNKIIKEIIPNSEKHIKNLLFLDGPGWITMTGGFQKTKETGDDFFQINTTDTKLKKILNIEGHVFPIDIEIAILECVKNQIRPEKGKVVEILSMKDHINCSQEGIEFQNSEFLSKIDKNSELNLDSSREEIIEKFMILEKLQNLKPSKAALKFKILQPSNDNYEINDQVIEEELKKIGYSKEIIYSKLKELDKEGTIIMQSV